METQTCVSEIQPMKFVLAWERTSFSVYVMHSICLYGNGSLNMLNTKWLCLCLLTKLGLNR